MTSFHLKILREEKMELMYRTSLTLHVQQSRLSYNSYNPETRNPMDKPYGLGKYWLIYKKDKILGGRLYLLSK